MTEREKSDFNVPNDQQQPSSKPSRSYVQDQGPASSAKRQKTSSGKSLLDMWTKNSRNMITPLPFVGMKSVGDKARLYLSLERKDKETSGHSEDLH